jgi:putative two-component system response regulator
MTHSPLLIVDDEVINLAILRAILAGEYRLMLTRRGAEAIDLARSHAPALVLLDIQMPDMDGYAVCRALKADPRTEDIPVIFVTAMSDEGNEAVGFAAGAADYLTKPLCPEIVRARVRAHLSLANARELDQRSRDALFMLAKASHYNDPDAGLHLWRMAAFARELAATVGWSQADCDLLELAAPLHDTGRIGIPDVLWNKTGPLDQDESRVMKTHCSIGFDLLSSSDAPLFRLAAEIARYHHEWWDGSGYLEGLAGEATPQSARIVAVADAFDTLSMEWPCQESWPVEQVMATLRAGAGKHFDPSLIAAFEDCLPRILKIKADWDQRHELPQPPDRP